MMNQTEFISRHIELLNEIKSLEQEYINVNAKFLVGEIFDNIEINNQKRRYEVEERYLSNFNLDGSNLFIRYSCILYTDNGINIGHGQFTEIALEELRTVQDIKDVVKIGEQKRTRYKKKD